MEKLEIYIPSLRMQMGKKEFQQLFNFNEANWQQMNVLHVKEEDRIYIKGIVIETVEVQLISIDLSQNIIAFTMSKEITFNMCNRIYELLISRGIDFQPQKLSFITQRPHNLIKKR